MSREEARAEALRRFGDAHRIEEELMAMAERRQRWAVVRRGLEDGKRDVEHALRGLVRRPVYALTVIATMALGTGAAMSIFGLVNAVLMRPLPYESANHVVRMYNEWEGTPAAALSPAEYFDYADGSGEVFASFGAWTPGAVNVTESGEPERVMASFVSPGALAATGVDPLLGRRFGEDDDRPGSAVALLSHGFWQRRFGGVPDIVGRTVAVNGVMQTIVGVMPGDFEMPDGFVPGGNAELFLPLSLTRADVSARGSHYLNGLARLAEGVSLEQATTVVRDVAARFVAAFPDDYPRDMRFGVRLVDVTADVVGGVRGVLLVLLGAVGFVLLIAAANVSGLVLTRAELRRREMAVRAALGAGRGRLVRMQLVESILLALAGGGLGVMIAMCWTRALVALQPPGIPRLDRVPIDATVLAFGLGVSLAAGAVFGLAPALASDSSLFALREGNRGGTSSRRSHRFRRGLIVTELALALVLLTGAGLLVRTLGSLLRVDPGFDTAGVLTTRVTPPAADYPEDVAKRAFWSEVVRRVSDIPGVAAAGAVTNLPLASSLGDINFRVDGWEVREGEVSPRLDWQVVTPGYFETVGMRFVRGRGIEEGDDERAPGVGVINQAAERQYFPNGDAIGTRFLLGGGAGPGWVTIVGIVNDVRHAALGEAPRGEMYLAHRQFRFWNGGGAARTLTLVIKAARGEPESMTAAVRAAVAALDPTLPLGAFQTLEEVASDSVSRPRFALVLLGAFAFLALVLAAVGTYGVISYATSQRAREMGIRMALGARRVEVVRLVVGQGMVLGVAGIALGIAGALVITRSLSGLLYDVKPGDPVTLVTVSGLLIAVTLAASALPARQATRVDPGNALRGE
jgi:putative ABC transport system permease protein